MSPALLFRRVAAAEMVTWTLLLLGMFLKYVTKTTDVGVQVFGLLHGVVFLTYVLVVLAVWVDGRWPVRVAALALAAAVPPLLTVWAERRLEREGRLGRQWRLTGAAPSQRTLPERVVASAISRPVLAVAFGAAAVCVATAALLWIGPPLPAQRG